MKIVAQSLLVVFFVITFFIGLLSSTFKFQILDFAFWRNTFQKHNVYQNLAVVSKTSFESQIGKEGGNKNDIKMLTDLITPENAKDVVNRNLQNVLNFANGKSSEIKVYLPIDKVPKNLLPTNLAGIKSEMTLQELLTKFNFQDWQSLPLSSLARSGAFGTYFFVGAISILILVTVLLILLVETGKRCIALGVAFILSGGLIFFLVTVGANLSSVFSEKLVASSSLTTVILGAIFPPVASEILTTWRIVSLIVFVLGLGLFFVKKPKYNSPKS